MKGQSEEQVAARCLRTLAALWARGSSTSQSSGNTASGTMQAPQDRTSIDAHMHV